MLLDKLNGGQSAFSLNHIKSPPLKTSRQNGAIIADVVYYQQPRTDARVTAGHIGLADFGLQHCDARCRSVRYRHQFIFQTENVFGSWGAVPKKPSSALCCSLIHASTRIEKHDPCPSSLVAEIPPPMSAHNFWLNAKPRPVPPYLVEVPRFTWPKFRNRRPISNCAMPIPVSCT